MSPRLLRLAVRWNHHGFDVAQRQAAAMSLYAAIDPHSSNSMLAVMDGEGTRSTKDEGRHLITPSLRSGAN